MNLLQVLEQEELARVTAGKTIPDFRAGDTVVVSVNVVEGSRKRVQAFEGVVIARRNRGINSSFIVRKISSGEGVERSFQTYSPMIASIEVKRHGDVRRAKLYYLRERSGKAARIKERLVRKVEAESSKRQGRKALCPKPPPFTYAGGFLLPPEPSLPALQVFCLGRISIAVGSAARKRGILSADSLWTILSFPRIDRPALKRCLMHHECGLPSAVPKARWHAICAPIQSTEKRQNG